MHWYAPLGERDRDAACADPELERASIPDELDEEVDSGVDDRRVEEVGG